MASKKLFLNTTRALTRLFLFDKMLFPTKKNGLVYLKTSPLLNMYALNLYNSISNRAKKA